MNFWPTTAESWSTLAANIVTVGGALILIVVIKLNLELLVYWQRRAATAAEAHRDLQYADGARPANATSVIMDTILAWSAAHDRYRDGVTPELLQRFNARQRDEYRLWVARLLAAFDLVLLDGTAAVASAIQAKIKQELAKHAPILHSDRKRFAISPLLAGIIREVDQRR